MTTAQRTHGLFLEPLFQVIGVPAMPANYTTVCRRPHRHIAYDAVERQFFTMSTNRIFDRGLATLRNKFGAFIGFRRGGHKFRHLK